MELPMAAAIAVLFAGGTYMILRPNLIRLVMGFGLYSNAVNLLLITIGGYTRASGAPFVGRDPQSAVGLMDPLPPDIILTAIVISFAVGALMLIICYRVYLDHGTDNPQLLPVDDDFAFPAEVAGVVGLSTSSLPPGHPPAACEDAAPSRPGWRAGQGER
jgi:multicomponent Na+:H+ antiporter subunit C